MKKTIIVIALISAGIASSCRKERTCECKTSETEVKTGFGAKTTVDNTSTKFTKKKQLKNSFVYSTSCFSDTYSYNKSGGNGVDAWSSVTTVEKTCELK